MSLKVIGAGPGRTGTLSLKTALEQLGYGPCHHMKSCIESSQQTQWFLDAANGLSVDWRQVFERYEAAVDWPSAAYYRELMQTFPEAVVIFSNRSPDTWYESVASTIFRVVPNLPRWLRWLVPHIDRWGTMVKKTIWDNEFGGQFEDREMAIEFFNDRLAEVKTLVPPERLLVHSAAEGWGPICEFLGVDKPTTAYPYINDASRLQRAVRVLQLLNYAPAAVLALLVFGIIV
jgi:hypothetical protein